MPENWRDRAGGPAELGCGFNEPWFGGEEPDAICVESYLQDINFPRLNWDCRLHPCPRCNTAEYLAFEFDECCRTLHSSKVSKGYERALPNVHKNWVVAKKLALKLNREEAERAILELGEIR